MELLTFDAAIAATDHFSKRHLLLGNGFSIACRPDIFVYGKLFEQADFAKLSDSARQAFDALATTDFERVIRTLNDTAALADVYGLDPSISLQMRDDSAKLKELLVQTCLLYTSPSPRDRTRSRMPSSA